MHRGRGVARSGRQAVATLEPARLQDGPTRARRHPVPEAVVLRPLPVVRLERSLHPSLLDAGRHRVEGTPRPGNSAGQGDIHSHSRTWAGRVLPPLTSPTSLPTAPFPGG